MTRMLLRTHMLCSHFETLQLQRKYDVPHWISHACAFETIFISAQVRKCFGLNKRICVTQFRRYSNFPLCIRFVAHAH